MQLTIAQLNKKCKNGEIYNYEIGNFAITHIQLRTGSKAFALGVTGTWYLSLLLTTEETEVNGKCGNKQYGFFACVYRFSTTTKQLSTVSANEEK